MQEVWLPVVGYEGLYEVSDQGRVRSLDRTVAHPLWKTLRLRGRLLKLWRRGADDYFAVNLFKEGVGKPVRVHILVATAFIGPRPDGMDVCHGEGGKRDNRPENLRYGTRKENSADKMRDGTHNRGERNSMSKLTEDQVVYIRCQLENAPRGRAAQVARELGVNKETVRAVKEGRNWAWLEP
jgi:hypothetical protein